MLYVPPRWGHDGVAEDECMTCSIGFRTPMGTELARELLQRVLDDVEADPDEPHFRDPPRSATETPARMPDGARHVRAQGRRAPAARPRRSWRARWAR